MSLTNRDSGHLRHRRRQQATLVDLTPLIDIVFQLLIFFLLTATFQESSSLDVDLARAKNQQKTQKTEAVIVSISALGAFEVDQILVDPGALESYLCAESNTGKRTLHIRADKNSKHEDLVMAMDLAKTCGFESLGILHQN
ncbi:Biopolymer transport protein ExbD/TolR [Enhygromyxa salina]|uniref:Biopolymer transport protein ExbD/TolR n=1 Tax=Enhygromyxa salina TaxID=215803 RepID=A0A0C2CWV1_9BACT|nr:biopolymer transporter ExbD [Enhygromyxa salina]KIG15506.1 Biopolymer transport protein ExbD/TolR [Enhygromyxa salina]